MASSVNITTNDLTHRTKQCEKQRSWGIWEHFNRLTGWRKSAFINTILVFAVLLVLISLHVVVWAKSGSLDGSQIIYSGSCLGNSVGRLNTFLHLLINILSSLVLASTNFFMQVLNAPSRAELDRAHEKGNWLDIGVPSPRNAFRVSKFKTVMWLLFFLSSIPIHLLFNSVIFLTDHREANFSYFVFDESISTGVAAFDPGASLSIPLQDLMEDFESDDYDFNTKIWRNKTTLGISRNTFFETAHVNRSRTIQTTVQAISNGTWHKLDISTCKSIYKTDSCSGLRKYRNVAIILSGSSGWNRSQLWDLPADESSFWDAHVPSSENNALWFAEVSEENDLDCLMKIETVLADNGNDMVNHCYNRCSYSMGLHSNDSDVLSYQLFGTGITMASVSTRPQFDNSSLGIEYCLAEPLDTVCQIGLASTLLLCVSFWYVTQSCFDRCKLSTLEQNGMPANVINQLISVLLKAFLCLVVITQLGRETCLVTIGDAIESFISQPADYIPGSCLLDQKFLRAHGNGNGHRLAPGATEWKPKTHRRWDAIPKQIWFSSYFIFSIGLGLSLYFSVRSYMAEGWSVLLLQVAVLLKLTCDLQAGIFRPGRREQYDLFPAKFHAQF